MPRRDWARPIVWVGQIVQARTSRRFATTSRALERWIPTGGVCLDIGANHGKFAKELAKLHGSSCRVLCFEPMAYNLSILRCVVGANRRIEVHPVALSDDVGEAELYVPVKESGRIVPGSAHMGEEVGASHFGVSTALTVKPVSIRTVRLDDFVEENRLNTIDFMKIDVEGSEFRVLNGGRRTIEAHHPAIYCEMIREYPKRIGREVADSVNLLVSLGYEAFLLDVEGGELTEVDPKERAKGDYLFLAR